MKNHYSIVQSIHKYLDLFHRPWYVEFGCEDFGASLSSLLELPISILNTQEKDFFLGFLNTFLEKCSISFILRDPSNLCHIDLALTGFWNKNKIAIPLWILDESLIGFEIIQAEGQYQIIDSFPLYWKTPVTQQTSKGLARAETKELIALDTDIFCGNTIYFRIEQNSIMIASTNPQDDLKFFERIASAVIPEIDDD
ncbi:MAG: hypothetical protein ACXAC6_13495 [Candidatus Hodarchaeales archaeon]